MADIKTITDALEKVSRQSLSNICGEQIDSEAQVREIDIVTWLGKMKIFSWEKFHQPTNFSIVNLYENDKDNNSNDSAGYS